jgi:glycosyltransferase involved in cell wall biosynthesis
MKQGIDCLIVNVTDYGSGFLGKDVKNWFSNKKFKNLIQNFKPNLIMIDGRTVFGNYAVKINIPLIYHMRGDEWAETKWALHTLQKITVKRIIIWYRARRAEKCYEKSSLIIPICNHLEKIVKQHYPNKKTNVLHGGITPSEWYPSKGMQLKHPCVGLLQRASIWGKAQEMLVLQKVLESMPNVMFYWVGDGPYRDKILSVLGKYDNFKWLGPLQYPDKVREYLTEIDVYALVSGIDMSPLTLQEAQLMKKPVVATNVGGIPEIMKDNETGFLVEKGNTDEWIKKLSLLIDDEEKRKIMGENGRKFIEENFSWNKIAKEFLKDIEKIS